MRQHRAHRIAFCITPCLVSFQVTSSAFFRGSSSSFNAGVLLNALSFSPGSCADDSFRGYEWDAKVRWDAKAKVSGAL